MDRPTVLQEIKNLNERLANISDLRAQLNREQDSITQRRAMLYAALDEDYRRGA